VMAATLRLLEQKGYEQVRMGDIAAEAGVGLGAMYRRWPGKKELVAAALQLPRGEHSSQVLDDPREDLLAALLRVCNAVDQGLGRIVAECLIQPGSELSNVAIHAKLNPLVDAIGIKLARLNDSSAARASIAPAFILWHAAVTGRAPSVQELESQLLPALGVPEATPGDGGTSSVTAPELSGDGTSRGSR
jgi:AcrR family transcriptional regulator